MSGGLSHLEQPSFGSPSSLVGNWESVKDPPQKNSCFFNFDQKHTSILMT